VEGLLCHGSSFAFALRRRLPNCSAQNAAVATEDGTLLAEIAPTLVKGRGNVVEGAIRKPKEARGVVHIGWENTGSVDYYCTVRAHPVGLSEGPI
jgi:hypothetical protein